MSPGAPFACGWLVAPDAPGSTYIYASPSEDVVEHARKRDAIYELHDLAPAAVAIQFQLAHPKVAFVISGAETPENASQNNRHTHNRLPEEVWQSFKDERLLHPAVPTPAMDRRADFLWTENSISARSSA
jgi:aryl-alcohol dehydrogenase-like predicted oxidoreductase